MTTTADLVETLVGRLTPRPKAWLARRLTMGLAGGTAVAAAISFGLWGPRPDLSSAIATWPFWIKFGYAGALAVAGAVAIDRLARPGGRSRAAIAIAVVAVVTMAVLAMVQFGEAPAGARRGLVLGSTSATCPWLIISLAVPIFAGGLWAVRATAPTRLGWAGAAIGLAAGALSAFVYAAACDEGGLPFVLVWYGLGMAVPSLVGAVLGRTLLRW